MLRSEGRAVIGPERFAFMARLDFAAWPAEKVLQTLKELGYGGVSWMEHHFHPRRQSRGELQALIQRTADAGLAVSEIVVQQDLVCLDEVTRRDRVALVREYIETAAEVGQPCFR